MINSAILPLVMAAAISYPNITYEIITHESDQHQHEVYAFEGEKYEETVAYLIYTLDAGACILRDVYTNTIAREILRFNDRHYQNKHFSLHLDTSLGVCVITILKVPNNPSLSLEIGNYRNRYNRYYYYHTEAPLYFPYKVARPKVKRMHRHGHRHKHVKPPLRHRKLHKPHVKQKRFKRYKKAPKQHKRSQQRKKYRNKNQNKEKTSEKHKKKGKKGKKSKKQQKRHHKPAPRRR